MSTGFRYSIAEGLRGLRRAKFSAFVSIFTIFISLVSIGLFLVFIFNVHRIMNQIKSRMELEAFIDNSLTSEQIDALHDQIRKLHGIDSVRYVSKAQAAEVFKKEVGQDIFEILDDNPLPASFQITLKPAYQTSTRTKEISNALLQFDGIDEVLYRYDIMALLERYFRIFLMISFAIGLVLAIGAIFLIYNTIKLIIFSRRSAIEIMKLVGATPRFIRRPFIIEGIIQGVVGGSFAAMLFYLLFQIAKQKIPEIIVATDTIYGAFILFGIFFGYMGSSFALRKFLKYH